MHTESPAPVISVNEPASAPAAHSVSSFPWLLGAGLLIYALYGITGALQRLLDLPSYTVSMFGCVLSILVLVTALASARPAQASAKPAASAGAGRKMLWVGVIFLGLSVILQAAAAFDAYSRGDSQSAPTFRVISTGDSGKHKKGKKNGDKKSGKEKSDSEETDVNAAGAADGAKKKRDTSTD